MVTTLLSSKLLVQMKYGVQNIRIPSKFFPLGGILGGPELAMFY